MGLTDLLRREWGYLKEDTAKAVASARSARLPGVSPERRTSLALLVGVVALVAGVYQWSQAAAFVVVGLAAILYAMFLVDLDAPAARRRRRTAARRKAAQ